MRTRLGAALLAVLTALLVAACGGGGGGDKAPAASGSGSVPAGADYVASTAVGFFSAVTDSNSSQWNAARDLLGKFPGKERLLAMVEQSLAGQQVDYDRDVEPALGPEVDFGILSFSGDTQNFVGLTQPDDQAKLEALARKLDAQDSSNTPTIFKKVGEWTAVADSQTAVDGAAAAHAGSSLADNAAFKNAIEDVPDDSILRLWLDGAALTRVASRSTGGTSSVPGLGKLVSLVASVQTHSDGLGVSAVSRSDRAISAARQYAASLPAQIPSGVLSYVSFSGLDKTINSLAGLPAVKPRLAEIEAQLGVSLAELAPLFKGEGALYVRQGIPIPEVTIALQESDEAAARTTADKLFAALAPALNGQVTATTVSGVAVKQIKGDNFSLYYGVFDGKLVVTDSTTGITGLRDSGQKLSDDSVFNDAKDAAGMPDETAGFVYVNLKDALPLVENLLSSFGGNVDPAVQQNLDPLKSLLFYSTVDGPKATFSGFVGVE